MAISECRKLDLPIDVQFQGQGLDQNNPKIDMSVNGLQKQITRNLVTYISSEKLSILWNALITPYDIIAYYSLTVYICLIKILMCNTTRIIDQNREICIVL